MGKRIDLTGQRFGRLVVVSRERNAQCGNSRWLCDCDCGGKTIVQGSSLRAGSTKSWGCLETGGYKHGMTYGSPVYSLWMDIKKRCYNKNYKQAKDYSGRGITVCAEWLNDFAIFHKFCMENGWKKGLEIDRKDNNGNYTPDNCRFVEQSENKRNARHTKYWVIGDRKYRSSSLAAEGEGVSRGTIYSWCGVSKRKNGEYRSNKECYAFLKYGEI